MAEAFAPPEIGGDHFRSSATFLTQAHPKQTEGSDVYVGTSMDQLYAKRFGQDTPIPSMQLCIEPVDQSGGCAYGYACVYTDTISWASPTEPLPMIRDPRAAFDKLFGAGRHARGAGRAGARTSGSILDWVARPTSRSLKTRARRRRTGSGWTATWTTSGRSSGASRRSRRRTAAASPGSCPGRPPACPTRSTSTCT